MTFSYYINGGNYIVNPKAQMKKKQCPRREMRLKKNATDNTDKNPKTISEFTEKPTMNKIKITLVKDPRNTTKRIEMNF